MADEVETNDSWDENEIYDFVRRYDLVLKEIETFMGKTKNHQDNNGLVYFDFDPKDLLIINNFLKEVLIPVYDKKMENPRLLDENKKESFEKFLHYLNGMIIQGSIIAKGSYKQNA
jgi:hypothetical protein